MASESSSRSVIVAIAPRLREQLCRGHGASPPGRASVRTDRARIDEFRRAKSFSKTRTRKTRERTGDMNSITPCLWFDTQGEEAAKFYTSVFPNSKIVKTTYYGEAGPRSAGTVLTVEFELNGNPFTALNGGP